MSPTQSAKGDVADSKYKVNKHLVNIQQIHRLSHNSLAFTFIATHFHLLLSLPWMKHQKVRWPHISACPLFSITLLTGFKEDGVLRGLEYNIAFWIHYDHIHLKCSNSILFSKARKSNLNNLKGNNNNNIDIYMHIYLHTYKSTPWNTKKCR